MATQTARVRRKRRPASGCPNPLFLRWVEEWRDEARDAGSKTQYTYTKALNSLKKYPLPLVSGQEAKILDHVGDKLAKKLDKKLAQHRASEGDTDSLTDNSALCVDRERKRARLATEDRGEADYNASSSTSISAKKTKKKWTQREYVPDYRSGPYAIIVALHTAQQKPNWLGYLTKVQLLTQAQPFCDKSFTIPDDGTYYTAWSSMSTLIRKGLVDKRSSPAKFRLTETGEDIAESLQRASSLTTAITSSSTSSGAPSSSSSFAFLNSTHAPEQCRPPTFKDHSHTDSSAAAAAAAAAASEVNVVGSSSPTSSPDLRVTPRHDVAASVSITLSDSEGSSSSDVEILPLASRIGGKSRSGIGQEGGSSVLVSTPLGTGSQICCVTETPMSTSASTCSGRSVRVSGREGEGDGVLGTLRSGRRNDVGAVMPAKMAGEAAIRRIKKLSERKMEVRPKIYFDLTMDEEEEERKTYPPAKLSSRGEQQDAVEEEFPAFILSSKSKRKTPSSVRQSPPTLPPSRPPSTAPSLSSHTRPTEPASSSSSGPPSQPHSSSTCTSVSRELSKHCHPKPAEGVLSRQGPSVDLGRPLFELRPGEFEVILCVDSAESTASRKSNSQFRGILLQELGKNGVKFDVRKLNIGDFLWIARKKVEPLPGQLTLPQSREAVLEYVVERKRMDDLAGSITDGRFREQKFRMKHSGVKYPMYLVEEFKDKMHLNLPLRSLEQAISNIQIIDGFQVHRATDIRESVAYLTILTRQLQQHYSGKTIRVFPWDTIAELNKPDAVSSLEPGNTLCTANAALAMEFGTFNEASVKNKVLTVYEMFGRHLMQIPGLSAERAAAILDHYPTITALRDAYQRCHSDSDREALVCNLKAGQNRRLGKNIGKCMYDLYWKQ